MAKLYKNSYMTHPDVNQEIFLNLQMNTFMLVDSIYAISFDQLFSRDIKMAIINAIRSLHNSNVTQLQYDKSRRASPNIMLSTNEYIYMLTDNEYTISFYQLYNRYITMAKLNEN